MASINIPEYFLQLIDEFVKYSIFADRQDALFTILELGLSRLISQINLNTIINSVTPMNNEYSKCINSDKFITKTISFKAPIYIHEILNSLMQKLGIKSKSDVIRMALLYYYEHFIK